MPTRRATQSEMDSYGKAAPCRTWACSRNQGLRCIRNQLSHQLVGLSGQCGFGGRAFLWERVPMFNLNDLVLPGSGFSVILLEPEFSLMKYTSELTRFRRAAT